MIEPSMKTVIGAHEGNAHVLDVETLRWCEAKCRDESKRMEGVGKNHPENSGARGRCFARARSLHAMAELFKWQYHPDMLKILRNTEEPET